jgi:cytochrome P450
MLDLFSDETRRNPFPLYDLVRQACPVMFEPNSGLWLIFDYAGVKRALDDTETLGSDMGSIGAHSTPSWLVFKDPPRHTKLRNIISQAFTPRVVAAMEPRIRQLSRDLLDRSIEHGEMDVAADFSVPLPMRVIAEMIGIPEKDWQRYTRWSNAMLQLSYSVRGMSPGKEAATAANEEFYAVTAEMSDYLAQLVADRRERPQDDLLTRLATAEVDGERLSPEDLLAFFQLLIVGGQETTTNLINNAVLCLLDNPEQLALLRRSPELLPSAIEETLRYRSPFQFLFRGTRREVEVHGQVIPAGKLVLLVLGSANRDPKQFRDAHRFDITRNPNPHLAFGHGIHFCLGAPLSRLEAKIALTDVLDRLPNLELASDAPWPPRPALHIHGPAKLPVRFGKL